MSLFQLVRGLKESSTYQAILEKDARRTREGTRRRAREGTRRRAAKKGRAEGLAEAIKMLIKIGTKRFGPPDPAVLERIEAITDLERIEALSDRLLEVASWDELLAGE